MTFNAVIRNIFRNDLLHPLLDTRHIFEFNGASNPQIAEITFWNRMFHKQFSLGKEFRDSLKQDKTKRTDISTHTGLISHIQKLYILIIIYSEIKSLGAIIDLGTHYLIRKIKIKTVINIQKWASDREFFINIIIFATYL